jgi:hypothetical protein
MGVRLTTKGVVETMEFGLCPYCETQGLVLSTRPVPGGIEVNGRCVTCGYTCDSAYASAETTDDLPYEFDWIDQARTPQ